MKKNVLRQLIMLSKRLLYAFLVQLFMCTVLLANTGNAQRKSIEEVKLSIDNNGKTLIQFFQQVENKTDFKFTYDHNLVDLTQTVAVKGENTSLYKLLESISKQTGLRFIQVNENIHVKSVDVTSDSGNTQLVDVTISGTVTNAQGEPLPGVTITVPGTTLGTITNLDGKYSLTIPEGSSLLFSFIGFETQRIAIGSKSVIDVELLEDMASLDEVVVIGYGTMKKSSVTSSITKIENKQLDQVPVGRPESALVGRMAGVNISQIRTLPGESPEITIRGPGSISASNYPLIVIDGYPGLSFSNVNMNDIESIEVLKDASSAAIYGSRGSGGVILITTKKGESGKPRIRFNSYFGVANSIRHGMDAWVPGGQEFHDYTAAYINRDYAWVGGDTSLPLWGDERRPVQYRVNPVISEGNYNWEDILLNNPVPVQNYSMSVSGGKDNYKYYVSGVYKNEKGYIEPTSYKQYSFRINMDLNLTSKLKMGFSFNPSYSNTEDYINDGINNLIKMPPFLSPIPLEDGSFLRPRDYWGSTVSGGVNPLASIRGTEYTSQSMRNVGDLFLNYQISDKISVKSTVGHASTYTTNDNFRLASATGGTTTGNAYDGRSFDLLNENTFNYHTQFSEDHDFTGLLGASFQKSTSRGSAMYIQTGSYANEIVHTLNNALIHPTSSYTSKSHWGLASFFGRANYAYKEKYLFSASLRTDGSSRFGSKNRWGIFPSASAAWRIINEDFMANNGFFDDLKIRASYGAVGNFNIGNFAYLGTIGDVVYAPDNIVSKGKAQTSFGNQELQWERTESMDIGVDFSLADYRINVVLDFYVKNTKDLLYNVSIPSISGFTNTIDNVGNIRNSGVEFELNTRNMVGKFNWNTSFNVSYNKNEVISLSDGVDEVINTHSRGMGWLLRKGEPMFSFYGYKQVGVFMNQEDLDTYPHVPGQFVGTSIHQDTNGDGSITPEDRVVLGNFMPGVLIGMMNDFSYGNFDLSIALQSTIGNKMYNLEDLYYQGPTVSAFHIPTIENQWWSESNPGDGNHPATSLAGLNYVAATDFYIQDASFLAIRNINLGYKLPAQLINKMKVTNCRVYTSISNALLITKKEFHGYNPQGYTTSGISGIGSMPGFNNGSEPLQRTYAIGVDITF